MSQNYIMKFGKYKGKDLLHIMTYNPKYIEWLLTLENLDDELKNILTSLKQTQYYKDMLFDYLEAEMRYLDACDPNF